MTEWELMWWVVGIGITAIGLGIWFGGKIPPCKCRCGL